MSVRLAVVIPAFGESKRLAEVIRKIPPQLDSAASCQVVVVDAWR